MEVTGLAVGDGAPGVGVGRATAEAVVSDIGGAEAEADGADSSAHALSRRMRVMTAAGRSAR